MSKEGERGNVILMALIVFLVVAILLSGLFIVPSALSLSTKHTNTAQAQYAAEAGVKRVVAACEGEMSSWDWVEGNRDLVVDGSPKYNVTINTDSGHTNMGYYQWNTHDGGLCNYFNWEN